MNWLEQLPDISLKTIGIVVSALDWQNISDGHLKVVLDEGRVNRLLKQFVHPSEYVQQIYVRLLGNGRLEVELDLKIKGFGFRIAYLIEVQSFEFAPQKHRIALKVSRQERHGKLAEGLYELTLKPYLINRLRHHGVRVSDPYLMIDLSQNQSYQSFKSSFIGTLVLNNLVVTISQFVQGLLVVDLDLSSFKECIPIIKKALEKGLTDSLSDQETA